MGVGIDKAGRGGMTVEVDDADAGSIAREFQNFGVGADFHDDATSDGYGLDYRIVGIHGEDVAVNQDEVGGGILRGQRFGSTAGFRAGRMTQ